jgi:Histidine kinase
MSKRKIFIAVGILLFLLQPFILPSRPTNATEPQYFNELVFNILGNILIVSFFYVNYIYLIPRFLFKRSYLQYGLIVSAGLALILLVPWFIIGQHNPPPPHFHARHPNPDAGSIYAKFRIFFSDVDHIVFLFVGTVIFSVFWFEKMQNQKIKNEKLQAELSHLKLQIHPHFLFNTLNSIYAFAIKKDDRTAETVLKLADFMRYLLQESYRDEVHLDKEIHYINNYIDLQKSRLRDTVLITHEVSGDFSGKKIAPLLLFTFIENAFKYGVNPEENSVIKISLTLTDNELVLKVFNNIVSTKNIESTNIGIQNTKDRLELYYPNKHKLTISDEISEFRVTLKIELS